MKKKNIVFYFEDKAGLGHACGFQYLFESLKDNYNILLFFSGDNKKHHFLEGVKTIYLPFIDGYKPEQKQQKCKLIREFLYDFPPDIFFIDYYPFGKYQLRHEMREIIFATKANRGKVYTFMRDIYIGTKWFKKQEYLDHKTIFEQKIETSLTEQMETSEDELLRRIVHNLDGQFFRANLFIEHYLSQNLIDGFLMFGDENLHRIEDELNLEEDLKKKFYYLGYIVSDVGVRYTKQLKKTKKIIVSSGGSITSEKQFLQVLLSLSKISGYKVDIFLGDFVREEFKDFVNEYFQKFSHMRVSGFVSHFREKLAEYDFYFGFGGYGTFLDLLYDGIPAFIFPNFDNKIFADRKLEQENRIKILKGRVNMFPLEEFSVEYIKILLEKEYPKPSGDIRLARADDILSIIEKDTHEL